MLQPEASNHAIDKEHLNLVTRCHLTSTDRDARRCDVRTTCSASTSPARNIMSVAMQAYPTSRAERIVDMLLWTTGYCWVRVSVTDLAGRCRVFMMAKDAWKAATAKS